MTRLVWQCRVFALSVAVIAGTLGCGDAATGPDGGAGGGGGGGGGRDGNAGDGVTHDGAGGNGGPCWQASDCTFSCTAPGQQVCGGVCSSAMHPCTTDSECTGGDGGTPSSICDPVPCACPAGKGCLPGCSGDGDCASWMSCGTDHRCTPRACASSGGAACPTDFACGADGHCARKGCTADTQCSNACVNGACYGTPGICTVPVP
jgi:hypothetical protein